MIGVRIYSFDKNTTDVDVLTLITWLVWCLLNLCTIVTTSPFVVKKYPGRETLKLMKSPIFVKLLPTNIASIGGSCLQPCGVLMVTLTLSFFLCLSLEFFYKEELSLLPCLFNHFLM